MITILIANHIKATVTDGKWSVPDIPALAEGLSLQNPLNTPNIPNFDWACAQAAVNYLGEKVAKITSPVPTEPAGDGKIY